MTPSWPPARVKQLTELFHFGLSASAIALKLGAGLSRNAVIGKLQRLGLTLSARPNRVPSRGGIPGRPRRSPAEPWAPPARSIVPESAVSPPTVLVCPPERGYGAVTILGLRDGPIRQCRWPIGEPSAEMLYCGRQTVTGSSWCSHHHSRVWRPVPAKYREAAE
jgi:GcrA cell cycle regulator